MNNNRVPIYFALSAVFALISLNSAHAQYYATMQYGATPNTGPAANVSGNFALLTGSVNPNGYQATAWFEYGTNNSFGSSSERKNIGDATVAVNLASQLSGLTPNTIYYYRIAAQSNCYNNNYNNCIYTTGQGNIQYGQTLTFTTTNATDTGGNVSQPGVDTTAATDVARGSATMHGVVRPQNGDTTVWFEYGTTGALGLISPSKQISAINTSVTINFYASGLKSGTTYHYRMVGQNTAGKVNGATLTLTTIAAPAPAPAPTSTPQPQPQPQPQLAPIATTTNNVDLNQPPLSMNVRIESPEPTAGDELKYTVTITNQSNQAVKNVSLSVNLPVEIKYIDGGQDAKLENSVVKIGFAELEKGGKRIFPLRLKVQDSAQAGANLPIGSFLTYVSQNKTLAASANANVLIKAKSETPAGTVAVLSENLPAFLWLRWVLWVLVIFLVVLLIYIAYRFLRSWLAMH
ncbi:MAG: hypothetical protein V1856_01015 [Candidatus Liptonbacteria bacterium]